MFVLRVPRRAACCHVSVVLPDCTPESAEAVLADALLFDKTSAALRDASVTAVQHVVKSDESSEVTAGFNHSFHSSRKILCWEKLVNDLLLRIYFCLSGNRPQ